MCRKCGQPKCCCVKVVSLRGLRGKQGSAAPPRSTVISPATPWIDLAGFDHYNGVLQKPQYRVYGKMMWFRGDAIVPIDDASVLVPITADATYGYNYLTELKVAPFAGVGGVNYSDTTGLLTFNNSSPVIPAQYIGPGNNQIDGTYKSPWRIAQRHIVGDYEFDPSAVIHYAAPMDLIINQDGTLALKTVRGAEEFLAAQPIGHSSLRYITANAKAGQRVLDARFVGAGLTDTFHGSALSPLDVSVSANGLLLHEVTMDAALPSQIGGWVMRLDGLVAYLK